jgi:thymidylate kinase
LAFLERVRQTYLERAKEQPARFEIIDASQDEAAVWAQIQAVLERRAR